MGQNVESSSSSDMLSDSLQEKQKVDVGDRHLMQNFSLIIHKIEYLWFTRRNRDAKKYCQNFHVVHRVYVQG